MKNLYCILYLLLVMSLGGVYVMFDEKIKMLEEEMQQKEIAYKNELEEIKKTQRLTSADVDFIQMLVIEGGEK